MPGLEGFGRDYARKDIRLRRVIPMARFDFIVQEACYCDDGSGGATVWNVV